MNILFKREQTSGKVGKVIFKLWCKIKLTKAEQALVKRYKFDQAALIGEIQPKLVRNSAILGVVAGIIAYIVLRWIFPGTLAQLLGLAAAGGVGYWYFHNKRELIFVRDLIHGRHFSCATIINLAKKEGKLKDIVFILRQVMESAKHWDDTETAKIDALPKEEARRLLRSL